MKTCEECGKILSDDETICPECGGTMFSEVHGLELRSNKGPKKKPVIDEDISANMEKGDYSDLEQDVYGGGSGTPFSLTKEQIKEKKSEDKKDKKHHKSGNMSAVGTLFFVLVLVALGFGVWYLFTNVILKNEGPESQEECIATFVQAINDAKSSDPDVAAKAAEKMEFVLPPYLSIAPGVAQETLEMFSNVEITKYEPVKSEPTNADALNDYVQADRGKSAKIKEAFWNEYRVFATVTNARGAKVQKIKNIKVCLVKIKDRWYYYNEDHDFSQLVD